MAAAHVHPPPPPAAPLTLCDPAGHSTTTTGGQYAHIAFPLPTKRYVGMLHCQRDPLASELVTRVVRCEKAKAAESAPSAAAGGKSKSKGKGGKAPAPQEEAMTPAVQEEWEVELEDTVLFPEGGGQPSDTGRIVPLPATDEQSSGTAVEPVTVRQVIRRNLDAVHFVSQPLEVGQQVRLEVDMVRRHDLMDQHTGQHLLSAVLEHEHQLDTVSWSLQKFPELNYIELARAPSPEQLASVQQRCNDLIGQARPIRVKFELATDETGVKLGDHVPSDYRAGEQGDERPPVQRTVIIDELDENPCCGTHYPSLAYLRTLYISPHTTSVRGTNQRLYFCVGAPRTLAYLASIHAPARQAALEAGCGLGDLPGKVEGLLLNVGEARKREKRLQGELAGFVARDLWERGSASSGGAVAGAAGGMRAASLLREEDATNSLEFLSAVSLELKARSSESPPTSSDSATTPAQQQQQQQRAETPHLFLLACGATSGAPHASSAGGALLILSSAAHAHAVALAGQKVVEAFGKERVKGGGKGRWQGKVSGRWEQGDAEVLERIVQEVVTECMGSGAA